MDSYKIEIRYHEAGPLFQCVRPYSCDFDFSVSGLIHVILMIQYERKGAAVMSHTPAYTVIQTPEADKLADIRDVSVNKDLPREERIAEFIRQIRDPYHFKCGRFVVRASFSQEGATLEECLRGILR